jgi:hypothetical protein
MVQDPMSEDKEHFLSRWSRRKIETRQAEPVTRQDAAAGASSPPTLPVAGETTIAPTELPPVDSLQGLSSEYKDFLKPGVDDAMKRAALKKLFHDPHFHFANMDKLDTYIDDYSIEDPIPEAMLRSLNQAKSLFLFDDEKKVGEPEQAAVPAAQEPALQTVTQQPVDAAAESTVKEIHQAPSPAEPVKPA